jgi:LPXTG-motif cell wall-anchored protein
MPLLAVTGLHNVGTCSVIKNRAAGLLLGAGLVGAGVFTAGPASADCTTNGSNLVCSNVNVTLTVGDTTAGGTDTVSFPEDSGISADVFVQSSPIFVGAAVGNAQNVATLTFTVPASLAAGTHHVVVHGTRNGQAYVASLPLVVTAPALASGGAQGGLPKTGSSNVVPLTGLGLGLVVIGAGVLMVVRRRTTATGPLAV